MWVGMMGERDGEKGGMVKGFKGMGRLSEKKGYGGEKVDVGRGKGEGKGGVGFCGGMVGFLEKGDGEGVEGEGVGDKFGGRDGY